MRLIFTILYCVVCMADISAAGSGKLLHLGLTDSGWQVFEYDLSEHKTQQLTFTKGDKSSPRFVEALGAVAYRDSSGYVCLYRDGKESRWSDKMGMCSRYTFTDQGKTVLYTWWAVGSRSRHHLWRQGRGDDSPVLAKRPEAGSFAHLALSPDEKFLVASQIQGVYEERLVLLDLKKGGDAEYLTPKSFRAMYPAWSTDGSRIMFSRTQGPQNYDLYEMDIATRKYSPLVTSTDANEFAPVEGNNGEKVYFEKRSEGQFVLAVLDRKSGEITQLELPYSARGPYWYE